MKTIKILKTSSYGAGWSTWSDKDEVAEFMLTYQPLIDYIEAKKALGQKHDLNDKHPLVKQMLAEIDKKWGEKYACVLSANNLVVEEVTVPSLIQAIGLKCHDGKEYF